MRIIILAAGKGRRMGLNTPKVLAKVKEKSMVEHLLVSVLSAKIDPRPIMVVGHQEDVVKKALRNYPLDFVTQDRQLGTGHAVAVCRSIIDTDDDFLVLYGDHPLLKKETICELRNCFTNNRAILAMVTYMVPDFNVYGGAFQRYGRIIRRNNRVMAIREAKDASQAELEIKEVNPGYYAFKGEWLWENISKLQNNNVQKEYYLTDLVSRAIEQGHNITTIKGRNLPEAVGANTRDALMFLETLI